MSNVIRTREQWLTTLANKSARQLVRVIGNEVDEDPVVRLTCGFPASMGKRKPERAQAIAPHHSADMTAEVLISPEVSEPGEVALLALRALVAVYTSDYESGSMYRQCLRAAGLNEESLPRWAASIVSGMPAYPHAAVTIPDHVKQTTRLVKVTCPIHSDYIVRMSAKAFDRGAPLCGVDDCGVSMVAH